MSKDKYKNQYIYKKKYQSAIVIFIVAIVFLSVGILSYVLRNVHIVVALLGSFLQIPTFFIFLGGFLQLYFNYKYRQVVNNALAQRNFQGTYLLEDLAVEIGMKPKILLSVLLDLRNKGIIKYSFDPDSGQIILGHTIIYTPSTDFKSPPNKLSVPLSTEGKNFCDYCGHKLESEANLCLNCGSSL